MNAITQANATAEIASSRSTSFFSSSSETPSASRSRSSSLQPLDVRLGVRAVPAVLVSARRRQQADLLVVADRAHGAGRILLEDDPESLMGTTVAGVR
jgi:hypothetical protein